MSIRHVSANDARHQARAAVAAGEWQRAYDLLREADAQSPLTATDLALLAQVAYATGHLEETISTWERVYRHAIQANDELGAASAAVRVAMHLLFDTALMAPVRTWLKRVERHLEGEQETPVHAWLAVVRSNERMLSGDAVVAERYAREAIEIGLKSAPEAAALGRLAQARALILAGDVAQGVGLLNDTALVALSGELDPLFTGVVFCEVICGFQALGQYDLAEQWTESMERWRHGQPVGSVHGRCRVHRAEILRLRGACRDAESEVLRACEELRPYLRRELGWPLTELGQVRLRMGNLRGAEEALVAAHALGWESQPWLALVYLAQGRTDVALSSVRDALEHPRNVPSKELPPNTKLRRAPLLSAQVEIELAAGDWTRACAAADELEETATTFSSSALSASAMCARGRLFAASNDLVQARQYLEESIRQWNEIGAPYEAGVARIDLAHVYRKQGHEHAAYVEFAAARSALERIGAKRDAARAARAAAAASGSQAPAGSHSGENSLRREGDYWALTFRGSTTRIRDLRGLEYLAVLLSRPHQEFHVLDLVARGGTGQSDRPLRQSLHHHDAGPVLDAEAKAAYRQRLTEIEADINEAEEIGDAGRAAQARTEREFLLKELARAVGMGGRDRRALSASERARVSVTRAIRTALARIEAHNPGLAQHLDLAIRTGTYCAYVPDESRSPISWQT